MPENFPTQIGHSGVIYREAQSILTKTSGFLTAYDYSLNPYSGCTFGCSYCYAAFFARTTDAQVDWGYWVQVKENALELLRKKRKRPLTESIIYMSSVTDPYQPIEKKLEITRAILQELVDYHQPKLVIQTRAPLVTRDIDLLTRFKHLQVNMTVTTDDETMRRAFEPMCPSNEKRLDAVKILVDANITICITMTPLLPLGDAERFADRLLDTGVKRFVVQDFHAGNVRFAAGTGEQAREIAAQLKWDDEAYQQAKAVLIKKLPQVSEGKAGFAPIFD